MPRSVPLCLLLAVLPASAATVDKTFHETFDVSPGARLVLRHGDGDVTLSPWDRDRIDIRVRYHVEQTRVGVGGRRDFDVEFEQAGDEIRVTERRSGSGWTLGFHSIRHREYRYTIQAPAWVELDFQGDDGDVDLSGWRAPIRVVLDDGDLTLSDVSADRVELALEDGDLIARGLRAALELRADDADVSIEGCETPFASIHVEDGDLDLRACRGDFEIRCDDSDVRMTEIAAGSLDLRGNDGDLFVALVPGPSAPDVRIRSDDGRIVLELDRSIAVRYELSSGDGLRVEHPDAVETSRGERERSGTIHDGAGSVTVVSDDGSITLRAR